jgi:hypothetical protein
MSLVENHIFTSPIYFDEKKDWVDKLNELTDPYIKESRDKNKPNLVTKKDFGIVHHSTPLTKD